MIVSPLNGSVYEIQHGELLNFFFFKYMECIHVCDNQCQLLFHLGSAEEMFCRVVTECQTADSTEVTWVVNGHTVESSYLDGRALHGGRRCISTFKKAQKKNVRLY